MQGVPGFNTVIMRKDLNAPKVHVANGIQNLVTGRLVGKAQAFGIANAVVVKNNSVVQGPPTDQSFGLQTGELAGDNKTPGRSDSFDEVG